MGHVEQVYLRRQGPNRLSWGSKRVRVWHSSRGPRAWARAWSGLCPLGFGAGSECGLGYVGHVEQVYLLVVRRQGLNLAIVSSCLGGANGLGGAGGLASRAFASLVGLGLGCAC